jgi:hypothetical protein
MGPRIPVRILEAVLFNFPNVLDLLHHAVDTSQLQVLFQVIITGHDKNRSTRDTLPHCIA